MSVCKPTSTPGYGPELSNKQPEDTLLDVEETRRYQGIVGASCTAPKACATT